MIKNQVNQSERANDSPGEKRFAGNAPPNQIGVGSGDHRQRADPDLAMVATEFVPERTRFAILERVGVRQPVPEIDQPGREEKRAITSRSDGRTERSREEPKPRHGHEWSVEANQIEPDDRLCGRDSTPRIPQLRNGVPTRRRWDDPI